MGGGRGGLSVCHGSQPALATERTVFANAGGPGFGLSRMSRRLDSLPRLAGALGSRAGWPCRGRRVLKGARLWRGGARWRPHFRLPSELVVGRT